MRILITALALLALGQARAATDLVMSCDGASAGSRLSTCAILRWSEPQSQTLVASCTLTCTWSGADSAWRAFGTLQSAKVLRCSADITPATFKAGIGPDPCPESAKVWTNPSSTVITRRARWTAPTSNIDNTPLTDLAGYHLSVGPSVVGPWRLVASPTTTSVEVQVLPTERCARLVTRTRGGIESTPAIVCVAQPAPPTAFTFD